MPSIGLKLFMEKIKCRLYDEIVTKNQTMRKYGYKRNCCMNLYTKKLFTNEIHSLIKRNDARGSA